MGTTRNEETHSPTFLISLHRLVVRLSLDIPRKGTETRHGRLYLKVEFNRISAQRITFLGPNNLSKMRPCMRVYARIVKRTCHLYKSLATLFLWIEKIDFFLYISDNPFF